MADRLISADVFDSALTELRFNADGGLAHWGDRKDWCLHGSEIEKLIADAPTIDAVPVVRCKDCAHSSERELFPEDSRWKCKMAMGDEYHDGNFFCAWGERRESDAVSVED